MERPLLQTLPLSHPRRRLIERQFDLGKFKRVECEEHGPLGSCYWNVDSLVKSHGGKPVYGWQILYWPKLYVEALHHSIWERPDGSRVDVTAKYESDPRPFSTFIEDNSIIPNLLVPIFVPSPHIVLKKCPEVENLMRLAEKQLNMSRALTSKMIASGAVWVPQSGISFDSSLHTQFLNELEERMAIRREMSAAFIACAKLSS